MTKIALYIIGALIVLYLMVAGIKYGCSGISREGKVFRPEDGKTTIE